MKKTIETIAIILAIICLPPGMMYLGGAFIKLSWRWVPLVTEDHRLYIAGLVMVIWFFAIYVMAKLNDDEST